MAASVALDVTGCAVAVPFGGPPMPLPHIWHEGSGRVSDSSGILENRCHPSRFSGIARGGFVLHDGAQHDRRADVAPIIIAGVGD